ncbi:TIR domain-containing protein [Actinomycetes bacterium KLBMP 9759]
MSYRNKTYVAFASEDIKSYWLMKAWRENEKIDFDFHNAHDLSTALDTSQPDTIRRSLRQRLNNTKQVVLLGSTVCKTKAAKKSSFIHYEVETIIKLNLPVVVANLDQDRTIDRSFIPQMILDADYYTISVSFQPKIIKHALDDYAVEYAKSSNTGPYYYRATTYANLGL